MQFTAHYELSFWLGLLGGWVIKVLYCTSLMSVICWWMEVEL